MDRNDTNTVGTHGLCVRCIKGYSVMVLTGTDAQTVRPYRSRLGASLRLFDFFGTISGFLPWIFFISQGGKEKFFGLIV